MNVKHIGAAATGFFAIVLSAGAYAGAVTVSTVAIDSQTASGALSQARNASNSSEYIECSSGASSTTNVHYSHCIARDAAGNSFSCTTHNPKLIAVAQSVSEHSFITVYSEGRLPNGDRECTHLFVSNSSRYQP